MSFKTCRVARLLRAPLELTDIPNGEGWIHVVNGSINSTVTLTTGAGAVVQGQENIALRPFEYRRLYTDGNQEYRLQSTNNVMAAVNAQMGTNPGFFDSRLILPLTSDGITWPKSGTLSALYNNTNVRAYINTGRKYERYSTTSWNTFVNGADKATGINFRTPNSFSDIGTPGMILFESGDATRGYSAVLNSSGEIDIYYGAGQSTPRITSTTILSVDTDYIVVLETDSTTPAVRLFIEQASDFTNYEAGTLTAEASATPPDTNFSGASGVVLFRVADFGGFNGTISGKVDFFGEFYHLKLGDFNFSGTLDFELLESDVLLDFNVSPGSPLNTDLTVDNTSDYSQEGATRFIARGLISAYSGADGGGLESTPLCPLTNFSQRIALPLAMTFATEPSARGRRNGISIASAFSIKGFMIGRSSEMKSSIVFPDS